MGTNFYAHTNVCSHCHRAEKILHIGKRSGGWEFSFRGYLNEDDEAGQIIRSFDDWKKILTSPNVLIFDEYGSEISAEEFFKEVQKTKTSKALNHYDYCWDDARKQNYLPPSNEYLSKCWKDKSGWSFSDWEFC